MNLNELQPAEGSKFAPKRVGRGIGSGTGKTSGKGHKGQNARSGGGVRPGFEGGQMPLYRRLPKRGFKNIFAKQYVAVNVEELNKLEDGAEVTAETLKANGIISKTLDGVKILGRGELNKKLTVKVAKMSASAKEKIEKACGKADGDVISVTDTKECLENSGPTSQNSIYINDAYSFQIRCTYSCTVSDS